MGPVSARTNDHITLSRLSMSQESIKVIKTELNDTNVKGIPRA